MLPFIVDGLSRMASRDDCLHRLQTGAIQASFRHVSSTRRPPPPPFRGSAPPTWASSLAGVYACSSGLSSSALGALRQLKRDQLPNAQSGRAILAATSPPG